MRDFIDKSKINNVDDIVNQYEHMYFIRETRRKEINHDGHKYVKVAELIQQEKGFKGVILRIGGIIATLFSLNMALFSKNIEHACEGQRFKSIYARVDDGTVDVINNKLKNILLEKLNNNYKIDRTYQNQIKDLIKNSFLELHDKSDLAKMLSDKDIKPEEAQKNGQEKLEAFHAVNPLANYVQLKELESSIECPKEFTSSSLHALNTRHDKVEAARKQLRELNLNDKERGILVEKLLRGGDFDVKAQGLDEKRADLFQKLCNDIGDLSIDLYKGPLTSQRILDFAEPSGSKVKNISQEAYNEAMEVIESRTVEK